MGIGGDAKKNIEAISYLALILSVSTFSFITLTQRPNACFPGDIGTAKCPVTSAKTNPLGTWFGFPSSCPSNDACELFFNSTNRAHLYNNQGLLVGYSVTLSVECIIPSIASGANLQLQFAQFSGVAGGGNTTNFINVGGALVYIDGTTQISCPGDLISSPATILTTLNTGTSSGYIFRVIGQAGGGPGDNPRFGKIVVNIGVQTARVLTGKPVTITSTSSTYLITASYQFPTSTSESAQWFATNVTAASCLTLSACLQHGSVTCTIGAGGNACGGTITFSPAFSAAPNVIVDPVGLQSLFTLSLGALPIFNTQAETV